MSWKSKPRAKQIPTKVSAGISCLREKPDGSLEILLILQRNTYAYGYFVLGRYNAGDSDEMIKLFNGMSLEEKTIILGRDFKAIWHYMWLGVTPTWAKLAVCQNKFIDAFCRGRGPGMLVKYIGASKNSPLVWSIPKGRKDSRESLLDCAVREFAEETQISKAQYQIIPSLQHSSSHISAGTKYIIHSFIGVVGEAAGPSSVAVHSPHVNAANHDQVHEISDIRWMSLAQIKNTPGAERIHEHASEVMKKYKKHLRRRCALRAQTEILDLEGIQSL